MIRSLLAKMWSSYLLVTLPGISWHFFWRVALPESWCWLDSEILLSLLMLLSVLRLWVWWVCTTLSPEAGDYQHLSSSQAESWGFQTCCSWWDATAWLFTSLNKQRETYFQNEEWHEAAFWVSVSSTLPTDTHSHNWNRLWSTPWNKSKDVLFLALCHQLDGVGELVPLRKAAVFSQASLER